MAQHLTMLEQRKAKAGPAYDRARPNRPPTGPKSNDLPDQPTSPKVEPRPTTHPHDNRPDSRHSTRRRHRVSAAFVRIREHRAGLGPKWFGSIRLGRLTGWGRGIAFRVEAPGPLGFRTEDSSSLPPAARRPSGRRAFRKLRRPGPGHTANGTAQQCPTVLANLARVPARASPKSRLCRFMAANLRPTQGS